MFALKQAAILKIACALYVFNMLQALGKFSRRIICRWSQMYFLHRSCTFVRHNALIPKKVHRCYSSIYAVCRYSVYLVYFFSHSISYHTFFMEMIYKKSTLSTSGLLKASSDAGFDTCTFYVLRVLNALFKNNCTDKKEMLTQCYSIFSSTGKALRFQKGNI